MILFLAYFVLLFVISSGLGKWIVPEKNKLYHFHPIIGFALFLSILQIGYYPMQLYGAPSLIVHIWTLCVMIPGFIYGISKFKKEDLSFLKHWEFYVLVLLVFGLIKILPANEAGDDWFYMPFIMDDAWANRIYTLEPRAGWNWNIDRLYQYQGYYLLESFLYHIQNTIYPNVDAIFITFRTTMTLLFLTFASMILTGVKKLWKIKKKDYVFFLIEILSILLLGVLEWSHIYWGSFVIFPVMVPIFMLALREYVLKRKKENVLMIFILNIAMMSFVSSALFLNVFIIFSYFLYSLYKKQVDVKDYFLMLIPNIVYLTFLIEMPYLLIFLLPIYLLMRNKKIQKKLNQFCIHYLRYLMWALPVLFFVMGILFKLDFTWNIYRLGYSILIFNLVMSGVILFLIYHHVKIDPILYVFLCFVAFFFNPLTGPFISHFLTTTTVYYRLFYVTKNPVVIIFILYSMYQYGKDKPIFRISFLIVLLLLIGRYQVNLLSNTILQETYQTPYHYLLREDMDSRNLGEFLYNLPLEEKGKILSVYFSPRQYDLNYHAKVYRYPNDPQYKDELMHKVLYGDEELTDEEYIDFKNKMQRENYDYIITFKEGNKGHRFYSYTTLIYENDTYQLFRIHLPKW